MRDVFARTCDAAFIRLSMMMMMLSLVGAGSTTQACIRVFAVMNFSAFLVCEAQRSLLLLLLPRPVLYTSFF